jgi:hypothetical protein
MGDTSLTQPMGEEMPGSESQKSLEELRRVRRLQWNREWIKRKYASDPEYRERHKAAARERNRARYRNDPAFRERYKQRKRVGQISEASRLKKIAATKAWRARNPEHRENWRLKYHYGITLEQYAEILEAQGGVCLLCQKPPTEKRLAVDHNHETGLVRGLLHRTCNATLKGAFGDDIYELLKAYNRFAEMTTRIGNMTGKYGHDRL